MMAAISLSFHRRGDRPGLDGAPIAPGPESGKASLLVVLGSVVHSVHELFERGPVLNNRGGVAVVLVQPARDERLKRPRNSLLKTAEFPLLALRMAELIAKPREQFAATEQGFSVQNTTAGAKKKNGTRGSRGSDSHERSGPREIGHRPLPELRPFAAGLEELRVWRRLLELDRNRRDRSYIAAARVLRVLDHVEELLQAHGVW